MNQHKVSFSIIIFALTIFSTMLYANEPFGIKNLKVEYVEMPLGMDVECPRFSWQMDSQTPGCYQTAYRIIVTDEAGEKVWDSEKIKSDLSLNISYAGKALKPCTRYYWDITVWDHKQKKQTAASWFETGLMNPDPALSAWDGACWIGGTDNDMVLYSDYFPVFKINVALQLEKKTHSLKAGFMYGVNDHRLLDKNKNLYQMESPLDSSYILMELDISPLQTKENALLHIYRRGYSPQDKKDTPLKSFPVPLEIINEKNQYDKHTLFISCVLGDTHIYIDNEKEEHLIGRINLNPLGQGGDFIAFPVIANIGFYVPEKQSAYFSDIQIRNFRSPSNILYEAYQSPIQIKGENKEIFLIFDPSHNAMPMLRTTFSTSQTTVKKARLYVTARGIYECYLNGKRIGNDYFNPGLTQYNKTHVYQTYDVTADIVPGKNALGAILGEGWWSGESTFMGEFWNFFGDRQSLLAKLVITYTDGKKDVIVSHPDTWKYYNNGPIIYGSFFQGEIYDATKESAVKNWNSASYDDSGWKKATEAGLEGHISKDEQNKSANMPMVNDYTHLSLTGQFGDAVKKIKELTAISVDEVRPGVFIYDMGQNMAGIPKIDLKGMKPGQEIILRFAEVRYPDLPEYKENAGMIMLENIRAAMAQDIYICKGGNETIHPHFTFHGYQYVEITGIEHALPLDAVKGEVLSSVSEIVSSYETSNPLVNKLWENITWSTFANFMSIPTDCPQRNERMGWSGDISVFARTATYLSTLPQFLRRHVLALRDVQREDGRFPDIAPIGGGFGGVLWGSAGITVAWESYQQYGDKALLEEHYDAMKKYIGFLISQIDPETKVLEDKNRKNWGSLGDWLSPEYNQTEKSLLWEAYLIYDLEQMEKIARILNKKEDIEYFNKLYIERKAFFNQTYVDPNTGKTVFRGKEIDTQASYSLPLAFQIFDEANKNISAENFAATISREHKADNKSVCPPYSLMTGFIGTAWINRALSDNGYTDLAYKLLQQTSYPSWLYPIEQGATTIWERLDSYTHTNGFGGNNRMNSFNHYSFGAIGAWMYEYSLGIQRDENSPGFKHFILAPEPDPTGMMTHAKGHYDSMYGRIESSWTINNNECIYQFIVPANTSATLHLKAPSLKHIQENGSLLSSSKKVKYLGVKNGKYIFELQAGAYELRITN